MDEKDVYLDEDMFITKMALSILEGRSFDITGKKCSFDTLFTTSENDDKDVEDVERWVLNS